MKDLEQWTTGQTYLEPVCCKKQQKSSWPVTGLWNRGPLKILNGIKLILDDQGNHLDSYAISLEPSEVPYSANQERFLLFLTASRLHFSENVQDYFNSSRLTKKNEIFFPGISINDGWRLFIRGVLFVSVGPRLCTHVMCAQNETLSDISPMPSMYACLHHQHIVFAFTPT